MIPASDTANESKRLQNLADYQILDTLPEKDFDDLTRIASQICQTPISLIGLIDDKRQWFKSRYGLEASETPKALTFCAHALLAQDEVMVVPDSRLDERFHDNPMVTGNPNVVFYTGVPLVSSEGFALGTLCVVDIIPRTLDESQVQALKALSNQIIRLLELRKAQLGLENSQKVLMAQNMELERFASIAAHDLKSPLNAISGLSQLLLNIYGTQIDPNMREIISRMHVSSQSLSRLISGILAHSTNESLLDESKDTIVLCRFFDDLALLLDPEKKYKIEYIGPNTTIYTNETALEQLCINLVSNSIKYNDKANVEIEIGFSEDDHAFLFYVRDNGQGIRKESLDKIFDIFHTEKTEDRFGKRGNGIGLATVKKLVEHLGGKIKVESELGIGTKFAFSLGK